MTVRQAAADTDRPAVQVLAPPVTTRAVALLLPGGKADSYLTTDASQLTALRMRPFARSLHRAGGAAGLAVWQLRYRFRGWNGAEASPVQDADWALGQIRQQFGDVPVVLVGHSMGGRTALRLAGGPGVRGVVALAPWTTENEPVAQVAGRALLIAHGNLDMVTSPRLSRRYAERASGLADPLARVVVLGDSHAMLARWSTWHRLTTGFALATLGVTPLPRRLLRAVQRGRSGEFAVPV